MPSRIRCRITPHGISDASVAVHPRHADVRRSPGLEPGDDEPAQLVQFRRVDDGAAQPSLRPRCQVDAERALRIVGEDVDRQPDGALAKPDEPAPVLLVGLDVAVARTNRRQKVIDDDVAADAALVYVLLAVDDRDLLRERDLVWHRLTPPAGRYIVSPARA